MGFFGRIGALFDDLRHRRRRSWTVEDGALCRSHLELRHAPAPLAAEYHRALTEAAEALPGVRWARVNAHLARLIVAHEGAVGDDALVGIADTVEAHLGLPHEHFGDEELEHPADEEPIRRTRFERRVDAGAVVGGIGLRFSPLKRLPLEVDLAAALTALEGIPQARKWLVDAIGEPLTDLGLSVGSATASALLKGPAAPMVDGLRRSLRLRELEGRRALFAELEPTLCGHPSQHEMISEDPGPRPQPLPDGPIERYVDKAVFAAAGGFGLGLASTGSISDATAPLFGGIPRPAQLGREAFASQLGHELTERGLLIMRTEALRVLDRIDAIVITEELVERDAQTGRLAQELVSLLATARRDDLQAVVSSDDAEGLARVGAVEVVPGGHGALLAVRRLQREGRGVLVVSGRSCPALSASDVGLGLFSGEAPPPWGADLIGHAGLGDALLVLAATVTARKASEQSVRIAMVDAATSVVLSLTGLGQKNVAKVMVAAQAASLLSMANAVRLAHYAGTRPVPPPRDHTPWHALPGEEVLARLQSSREGLTAAAASTRTSSGNGGDASRASIFGRLVIDEIANPLTPVLAAGAGLSALTGAVVDASMITGTLGFNVLIGASQRMATARALSGLDREEQRDARVMRDGRVHEVDADALVVGDVVRLHAGEVVPADCRLLSAKGLEVDESSLTGESQPIVKSASPCNAPVMADRKSMLWAGTTVAAGTALAVVTAIGEATEAERAAVEAGDPPPSGVEKRLESLTELTAPVAALSGLAIMGSGLARKRPANDVIASGVSLAVAAVPEGLPLLASLSQLSAARRLADRGAIVRNPRAIEALGRVNVVCADKTGTLTEGRIVLASVTDGEEEEDVRALSEGGRAIVAIALRAGPEIRPAKPPPHATDRALHEGAARAGVDVEDGAARWKREAELPFEPARGFHAVLGKADGGRRLCVKGAPETVLARCTSFRRAGRRRKLKAADRKKLAEREHALAERGLRVLAVAERGSDEPRPKRLSDDDVDELTLVGFIGFADPVRPTARACVERLHQAGVRVIMLTGDHPSTARAIAAEIDVGRTRGALTGAELEALTDAELDERLDDVSVFARVTPVQKVRIVRAFQARGSAVAMTGDGANDAPAIRLADVGIAFGGRSTAAARHAADMVVADEGIETIVTALLEGRALWKSVRDAVGLLVGGNLGEIGFTLVGGLVSGKSPLNARQLLLVNILTDTAPALAVAMRPSSIHDPQALLSEGPEASLGKQLERDISIRAAITASCTSAAWGVGRLTGTEARANTVALLTLIGSQMAQTLVVGGRNKPVLLASLGATAALVGIVQTPVLSHFFGCRPLGPLGLLVSGTGTALAAGATLGVDRFVGRTKQ